MVRRLVYFLAVFSLISCVEQKSDIFDEVKTLHEKGDFAQADSIISAYLSQNPDLDNETVQNLNFEIERGQRVINDYLLTEDKFTSILDKRIINFKVEEFQQWENEGRFDVLYVNGEKRYANPSVSNLLFRYPELRKRKNNQNTISKTARLALAQARELKRMSKIYPDPVRMPRNCIVKQTLKVNEGSVPALETVSCWLPYPSLFQTQGSVKYGTSAFNPLWIDHATSAIRSVYFEAPMPESGPLKFTLEYEYTAYAYYREIDITTVQSFTGNEPEFLTYTREEPPHEIFTPKMRKLAERITAGETNPYLKAQKIYNWIADSIKYSYAREYSTLRNISEYCYENRYGDCGQEAILFITLCKISGVPARWQSGFFVFPNDEGMHDWSEIYIKPYGWIPVDSYMGIFFTSMTEDLTQEEREEMRDFYFGNIDHYRLVANKGHSQKLYPPKKHFRSETVDFQRGEVEWKGGNLYFPEWRWSLDVTEIQ